LKDWLLQIIMRRNKKISVSSLKSAPTSMKIPKFQPLRSQGPLVKEEPVVHVKLENSTRTKKVRIKRKLESKAPLPPPKRIKKITIPTPIDKECLTYAPDINAPLLFKASLKPSLLDFGVKAVMEWRKTFNLQVESITRILKYTDNHLNMTRATIYNAVLKGLTSHLLKTIHNTTKMEKLIQLLNEAFAYIHIPELQPIAVSIMIKLPEIPDEYIQSLRRQPQLLKSLPETIRHKVYAKYPGDFLNILRPHLRQYIEKYQSYRFPIHFDKSPKSGNERREFFGGLKHIVNLVHKSQTLYDELVKWSRLQFKQSSNVAFYSFRFDMFKAFQEAGCPMIDPTGWFIEALDAGITKGRLSRADCDLLNEMKHCSSRDAIQDIIILTHLPMVRSQLPVLIIRQLEQIIEQKKMPRDFQIFKVLLRLYHSAHISMNKVKRMYSFPVCETRTVTEFLPLVCILYLPWIESKPKELKLHERIHEYISTNTNAQRICRFFLIIVLLERVHSNSFQRAQQIIDLFLTLDSRLFQSYKEHFTDLINLTARAASRSKDFPDSLKTHLADFFVRIAKKAPVYGHVLAVQLLADMAHKFSCDEITNRLLHLNEARMTPEVRSKTEVYYERLAAAHPDIITLLAELGVKVRSPHPGRRSHQEL